MKSQTTYDYIIVGHGLAGACLSLQLLECNRKILVIDRSDEQAASRVAAGLFNPVTGRKMAKTWLADQIFPYLHQFYQRAEQRTNSSFFYPMPLYRPFISIEEQNEWMGKSTDTTLTDYIDRIHTSPIFERQVKNEFGGLMLKQCGYLNTVKFCESVKKLVLQSATWLEEGFDEQELKIEKTWVEYRNYRASKIIFCQGESVRLGTLFSWLPIQPLKGETLTIQTEDKVSKIYNRGVYIVPEIWRVGATYQFQDKTRTITEAGRKELVEKLNELVNFRYSIIAQSWGMRPTTPDRRPILGAHPEHASVAIFNGLGTKGVSLAPYFSNVLAAWLENNTPLNKEVDIHRYKHYNYSGNLSR
ncbi:MAG TPA: FAD-binding oxidoreductase [Cyclobacteriaceae bacterium]